MIGPGTRRSLAALAVAGVIAMAVGCTAPAPPIASPTAARPADASPSATLAATPGDVVTGLTTPWSMVVIGDSVLVSERDTGRIFEITPDRDIRDVLTVTGVRFGGEGGLLGLALSPSSDALFVYSTADPGNRVQRYPLSGEAGALSLGTPVDVITGLPAAGNHNAGRIAFGPDEMLYVPVGDAGDRDAAQDPESPAGTILRMSPDGSIPSDNPDPDSLVYSFGHRNVQGLAWTEDGRMFASEFGQNTWDELNLIEPGGNYGWPVVEGVGDDPRFIDPVQVWTPADASPSGLAAVGDILYLANLRGERLRAIPADDPGTATELLVGELGRLRDVILGPDGLVWVATSNTSRGDPREGDDRIYALDASELAG